MFNTHKNYFLFNRWPVRPCVYILEPNKKIRSIIASLPTPQAPPSVANAQKTGGGLPAYSARAGGLPAYSARTAAYRPTGSGAAAYRPTASGRACLRRRGLRSGQ